MRDMNSCPAGAAVDHGRKLVRTTMDYVQTQRTKYEGIIEEHLDAIEARLDDMGTRLEDASGEAAVQARHDIAKARAQYDALRGLLDRLRDERENAPGAVKKGVEEAAMRFKESLITAADCFRVARS